MNDHSLQVMDFFLAGYNCCQSILMTYGPELGLEKETAIRLGIGMGGGLGHTGHVCGFISGAVLVLGLSEDNFNPNETERKLKSIEKTAAFIDDCHKALGTINCRELIQTEIRTRLQLETAMTQGKMNICGTKIVQEIVRLLDEYLVNTTIKNRKDL